MYIRRKKRFTPVYFMLLLVCMGCYSSRVNSWGDPPQGFSSWKEYKAAPKAGERYGKEQLRQGAETYKAQTRSLKKLPKEAKVFTAGMKYISSGILREGVQVFGNITSRPQDTTLLLHTKFKMDTLSDFFISDHEVTNKEYRAFTNWVRDSILLSLMAQHDGSYYMDQEKKTLNWSRREEVSQRKRDPQNGSGAWTENWDKVKDSVFQPVMKKEKYWPSPRIDVAKLIYTYTSGGQVISVPVYPDTQVFIKEFSYSYNDPMAQTYYWHPGYDDHPVVGVNWHQANAYCHWRTLQFNQAMKGSKEEGATYTFRLPTESEWEYAAKSSPPTKSYYYMDVYERLFPWPGWYTSDYKGQYLANFGRTIDQNNFCTKEWINDGAFYPEKIAFYPPNDNGLYHMAGNVAEWTADTASVDFKTESVLRFDLPEIDSFINASVEINRKEDSALAATALAWSDTRESALAKMRAWQQFYLNVAWEAGYLLNFKPKPPVDTSDLSIHPILEYASWKKDEQKIPVLLDSTDIINQTDWLDYLHDLKVLHNNTPARIVKGGSWADPPVYLICGTRTALNENKCSSRIGFRVVMVREERRSE